MRIDHDRRALTLVDLLLLPPHVAASDPPESHNDLRKAILTLTPRQRAVVYFAFWEDLDSAAIAEILRVNPSTIRRELSRVKQQLQQALS